MKSAWTLFLCFIGFSVFGQITLEGYIFQEKNRGYLNNVEIVVKDINGSILAETITNEEGFFSLNSAFAESDTVIASLVNYENGYVLLRNAQKVQNKYFVKLSLKAKPGYNFEITLADTRRDESIPVDAIQGALIEVYNNTTRQPELVLENYQKPEFNIRLNKGNHYTVLIRKDGYLAKRMEAYVDVENCVLCFEGLGKLEPGVSENLTDRNQSGTFLANVSLEPLFKGKKIEIENIYYDLGKWNIRPEAKESLNNVAGFMRDNPRLKVELGSHTDARGNDQSNLKLSKNRAKAARNYLVKQGKISGSRITFKGYGETELVNRCKDGVTCEEEEHQQNRRTELKILGLNEDAVFRSLEQMKTETFFDEEALALSEYKQVLVDGDADNIPDDLKKYIAEQEKKSANIAEDNTAKVEDVSDSAKAAEDPSLKEKDILGEFPETPAQVETTHKTGKESPYRILLKVSNERLPDDHQIQRDFGNVYEYQWPGRSYYYFVGEFNTVEMAKDYLAKHVVEDYPTARIMQILDGYPQSIPE